METVTSCTRGQKFWVRNTSDACRRRRVTRLNLDLHICTGGCSSHNTLICFRPFPEDSDDCELDLSAPWSATGPRPFSRSMFTGLGIKILTLILGLGRSQGLMLVRMDGQPSLCNNTPIASNARSPPFIQRTGTRSWQTGSRKSWPWKQSGRLRTDSSVTSLVGAARLQLVYPSLAISQPGRGNEEKLRARPASKASSKAGLKPRQSLLHLDEAR